MTFDWNTFFVFLFGLELGSFANVCIYRWPRNQSILTPSRSHCPWCHRQIAWYDNIPVLSFLFLRAVCRQCKSPISWRYPLVELTMGLAWLFVWFCIKTFTPGASFGFIFASFSFVFVIIVTTMTDLDWKIIPDEMSIGFLVMAILASPINPILSRDGIIERLLAAGIGLFVSGGFLIALSHVGQWALGKEALGGGDIKLMAAFGVFFGWKSAVFILMVASTIGGAISLIGLLTGVLKRNQYIPFGPFLNLGALLTWVIEIRWPGLLASLF